MTKHILLTSDLSDESQRAFGPAGELAELYGAKVTILHVIQTLTNVEAEGVVAAAWAATSDPEVEKMSALGALEEQAKALPDGVEVSVHVTTSRKVDQAVADFAEEKGADMIVLSTHGRSGVRRLLLGSVAEGILRHSKVPVLSIPPAE